MMLEILAILIAVVFSALSFFFWKRWREQKNECAAYEKKLRQSEDEQLHQRAAHLEKQAKLNAEVARLRPLEKYQNIADAEAAAKNILNVAQARAGKLIQMATERTKEKLKSVAAEAELTKLQADNLIASASREREMAEEDARKIIVAANAKAEEIAGDALAARDKAAEYKKTVAALKNVIDGYGDLYLLPTTSLLDELAETFGYTEAGKALASARQTTRQKVKNGLAASCDYAESSRKATAIAFVTDAFNGKVDSILARSKSDNYGTLRQQIIDAFTLVNQNGAAFRNARINEDYLESRLEELKWGCAAILLRDEEREEQRRIREQIREEERAQKEFERALKESQKEEELLKRAMEKAREQMEKASAEQKSRYEAQLADLADKLKEAEEKNQRALSMAQQTKTGHVYVISNIGAFGEAVFKIGMTRRLEPMDRVNELGDASVPFPFDVHAMIYSEDAPRLEGELHRRFLRQQMNKVNPRKEFFKVGITSIREEVEAMGINAHWTMVADAMQYRETQAIERTIVEDTAVAEKWGGGRHAIL